MTVLIAVHNGGEHLHDAVDSVLAQTFGDFELLIVDDASTDDTPRFLTSVSDPRMRVVRNPENIGQAPSLNRGLQEARGAYVARLDADDTMLPARLERQIAVFDAQPEVALVGTWMNVVDENGRLWAKMHGDISTFVELVAAVLANVFPFGHPSLMYRRDVVLELGSYDASLAPAEDKDLYRRLALARHEVRVVREPLVLYRRHAAQLSQAQHVRQLAGDHTGMERFLAELSPDVDPGALRRFLETGVGSPTLLDAWLDAAVPALKLSAAERVQLERAVARGLARRAARTGPAASPALRWATRRDGRLAAFLPLAHTAGARRRARALASSPHTEPLRRMTRRSRLLRRIYANLE